MHPLLETRPMSGFPLSIGTSLAVESVLTPTMAVADESREVPEKIDHKNYTLHAFNVATLTRNMISCVPSNELVRISPNDFATCVVEEIEQIQSLYAHEGLRTVFYTHSYQYVEDTYGKVKGKLRRATTALQQLHEAIQEACAKRANTLDHVRRFNKNLLLGKEEAVLLLTHIPFDLLSYSNHLLLHLLESHTGVVKTRKQFNTKYHKLPGADLSNLPFMEYLLTKLGDSVMFTPDLPKERHELVAAMTKMKVHPLSSEASLLMMLK